MKVVVVGAGPSGLAAAHRAIELAHERGETPDVVLLEASDRAGGAIGTERIYGFLAERGADGFLTEKRAVIELARRLGIDDRLVGTRPARDGAYVVKDGELHHIPVGFSMMAPTRVRPFLRSPIMSWRGKLRALAEVAVPRGPERPDESLASFVRRRFGDEVLEALAQPLVSGIYGADPDKLSLRATMPRFLDEEARSGSVTLGLRRKAKATGGTARGARYGLFASFDQGMQVLVDALVSRIPGLRLGESVTAIVPTDTGAVVRTTRGEHRADRVILAANGLVLAPLLKPVDAALAAEIARVEHGSCATIVLGYDARVLPERLDGYGFIVPKREHRPSMAATFLSRKWPNRAPDGAELVRVFLHEPGVSEDECIRVAQGELRALVGVTREPLFARVRQWRGAMPQYHVGHLDLARRVADMAKKHAWLRLAGNSLTGVGIPDAVAAGEAAASLTSTLRDHAVSSAALGRVERLVRGADQIGDALGRNVRVCGHPEADGDRERLRCVLEHRALDQAAQPLGEDGRVRQLDAAADDRELFAAVAREHVFGAHRGLRHLGQASEHVVAGDVAEVVVHALEEIDVEHHQREHRAVALGERELGLETLEEMALVEGLGEAIAEGGLVHVLLEADLEIVVIGELENRRRADADFVAVLQHSPRDPLVVDLRAVGTTEIFDDEIAADLEDAGVPARHAVFVQADVGVRRATDEHLGGFDAEHRTDGLADEHDEIGTVAVRLRRHDRLHRTYAGLLLHVIVIVVGRRWGRGRLRGNAARRHAERWSACREPGSSMAATTSRLAEAPWGGRA